MRKALLSGAVLCAMCHAAQPASIRVSPVLAEVRAPAGATALTLRNDNDRPIDVQIRAFGWNQSNGVERLEPTTDVAVSPPLTTVPAGAEYTIRVVRVSRRSLDGEESYRV